jgi:hypothetical protein
MKANNADSSAKRLVLTQSSGIGTPEVYGSCRLALKLIRASQLVLMYTVDRPDWRVELPPTPPPCCGGFDVRRFLRRRHRSG